MPSLRDAALDLDDARRPEVGPGEFFLAGPDQLDRPAGLAGQARGLDGRFARVLAAVAGAGVGHDHPHRVVGEPERAGQLAAHAERSLRAGPHGQLAVLPLRHGGAGLERGVGDVGDRVRLLEADVRGLETRLDRTRRAGPSPRAAALASRVLTRPLVSSGRRTRSLAEIGGPGFHSALIAASARAACCSLGAATPTKSPSRTTTTSGMALAALGSIEASVAPIVGGRSTLPNHMPEAGCPTHTDAAR